MLESKVKESKQIHAWIGRYGLAGILVLAFIPNPLFDIAGIASGALEIPWWQFLLACAAGRDPSVHHARVARESHPWSDRLKPLITIRKKKNSGEWI